MEIEITKMSSRGQVVIPQDLRNKLKAKEGSVFAVFGSKDTLVLKRIEMPNKEKLIKDLEKIAKQGRKRAEELGLNISPEKTTVKLIPNKQRQDLCCVK